MPLDDEVLAMENIERTLKSFDWPAKIRILQYVLDRYREQKPITVGGFAHLMGRQVEK